MFSFFLGQVTTARGGSSGNTTVTYSYVYPNPTISAANPRVVQAPGGGTLVTLRGEYFGLTAFSVVSIFVDGSPCTTTTRISDTEATCVTPPKPVTSSGSRLLLKITVDGLASNDTDIGLAQGFRYADVICSPVCDWNEECSAVGMCNLCAPGWIGAGCKKRLFTLDPPEELVTSEDGLTASGVVVLNADLPASLSLDIVTEASNPNEGSAAKVTFSGGSTKGSTRSITFSGLPDNIRDGATPWTASIRVSPTAPPEFSLVRKHKIIYFSDISFYQFFNIISCIICVTGAAHRRA